MVHYLASDLNWSGGSVLNRTVDELTGENLGKLNQRYMPWGGNPLSPSIDKNPFTGALKDPLVWCSDDWDFPTNESLSAVWLGRIHRGTPWQTIYLKSADILQWIQVIAGVTNVVGTNLWVQWTGDTQMTGNQFGDAIAMAPVQDRHVASLLAYLMNTRPIPSLFSVNKPNTGAWAKVLHGLTALTNDISDSQLTSGGLPQFDRLVIRPQSSQFQFIAGAVQSAKASQPDGFFPDVGDILAVPQLSDQSPFLNWDDGVQQQRGISDEAYEILASQLLPLLRADPVGRLAQKNGKVIARFTGYDNYAYAIEVSSNLTDWTRVSTNCPVDGVFNVTNSATDRPQFYRSLLIQ